MLFGKLQLGLPDLLLQIGSCCADLIADDIVLADSSGLLQNIPDELADHGIHLFGTVGRGAITVLFVLGTVIAFVEVPSRFMRKIVCRLRLSEVSRQ